MDWQAFAAMTEIDGAISIVVSFVDELLGGYFAALSESISWFVKQVPA
ncbi:MAG: hypothetical protein ACI915_001296 [Gammaproteobacteria bacterium]|jgi:hypothetical protein